MQNSLQQGEGSWDWLFQLNAFYSREHDLLAALNDDVET
jgi:hypothetical protein